MNGAPKPRSKAEQAATGQDQPREGTSRAEWVAAAISAVLFLAMIGYMAAYAVRSPDQPPVVTVSPLGVVDTPAGHLVRFRVHNGGSQTAASVLVSGRLSRNGQEIEVSRTTLQYVPQGSDQGGGLFFSHDPAKFQLQLRAEGYVQP
jgi:uncharacterized protein (TIGR02588 family)